MHHSAYYISKETANWLTVYTELAITNHTFENFLAISNVPMVSMFEAMIGIPS